MDRLLGVEGLEDLDGYTGKHYFPDTFLDSPVLITPRGQFVAATASLQLKFGNKVPSLTGNQLKTLSFAEKKAWNVWQMYGSYFPPRILDPDEYPVVYGWVLPGFDPSARIGRATDLANKIYTNGVRGLEAVLTDAKTGKSPSLASLLDFPQSPGADEMKYYHSWSGWNHIVDSVFTQMAAKKEYAVKVPLPGGGLAVTNCETVLLRLKGVEDQGTELVLTWDQLLMIKDVHLVRAQMFTAARVLHQSAPDLVSALSRLVKWQEECLTRYGNDGFEILKQSESLAKAHLSLSSQDEFGDAGPYHRMVVKIRKKEDDLGASSATGYLADSFSQVLGVTPRLLVVVEVFGMQKISGHPMVDPESGGLSAAAEARSPDATLPCHAQRIDWNFKRIFLENYVPKHGWPALVFSDTSTELYKLYTLQKRELTKNSYPLSDWRTCKFPRIFEFDFSPNYLDLMDDKSISYYRSSVAANWDPTVKRTSQRRLLLELLSREEISPQAIVYMVMRREIPADWMIVSLYPKERELKVNPRMFSMMVFEMRLYFTLLESNIASSVFPYLPQQTMTKDKISVARLFLELTRPRTATDMLSFFLEIDLTRWNLRFRQLTVHGVGQTLDDMFGMPGIYTYVHEFFSQCWIVVRVSGLEPAGIRQEEPPEGPLFWRDHLGGFEGISQKHWSICTYSMIDLALQDLPVSYRLVGQADNQVISVQAPRDPTLDRKDQLIALREEILKNVSEQCRRIGQEAKPEECLESTSVITYSKDIYIDGVYHPTSLKFHSRLFPHSSSEFPSVRTNVGAVFSTAAAGAEKSTMPFRSYYLALFHSAIYLDSCFSGEGAFGDDLRRASRNLSPDQLQDLIEVYLTLPSDLGGLPVAGPFDFLYKGGSDPLSKAVANLVTLQLGPTGHIQNRILAQMDKEDTFSKTIRPEAILKDPYSIPLSKPVTQTDGITDMTIRGLIPRTKNRAIRELLSDRTTEYCQGLAKALLEVRPFNPLLLRDVLECSVHGIAETVRKMFVATRTIQSVVRTLQLPIIPTARTLELDGLLYIAGRYSTLRLDPWRRRPVHELCLSYRRRWVDAGIPEPEGITTYDPIDFPLTWGPEALATTGLHAICLTGCENAHTTRGPYDPYVGGKTLEKRSEHGYRITSTDTTSEAFRKLQMISSQTGKDPAFQALLDAVGLSRSNTVLSSISDLLPAHYGGTWSHRYATRAGYQESFGMGSPNFATHCLISTDMSGKLSGGDVDVPFMHQPALLFLLWGLDATSFTGDPTYRAVCMMTDEVDMSSLPGLEMVLPPQMNVPLIRFVSNPLAFVDSIRLERRIGGAAGAVPIRTRQVRGQLVTLDTHEKREICEAWLRMKLRSRSLARLSADSSKTLMTRDTMDIAEVVSIGVDCLILASANVLVDEYLLNSLRTVFRPRQRWRAEAFMVKLVDTVASFFSPHVTHRLLRGDPAVKRLGLYEVPVYISHTSSAHSRVAGAILTLALTRLADGDKPFWCRCSSAFAVRDGTEDYDLTITVFARLLYWGTMACGLTRPHHRHLCDHFVLPALRLKEDNVGKLLALDAASRAIAAWLRKRGNYALATQLSLLQEGKKIRLYRCTPEEALRQCRSSDIIAGMAISRSISTRGIKVPRTALPVARFQQIAPRDRHLSLGTPCWTRHPALMKEYLASQLMRYTDKDTSPEQLSAACWAHFRDDMADRVVYVVGVGFGLSAMVALLSGASRVIGIERQCDLPLHPHRFISYAPPAVCSIAAESRFSLHFSALTGSGDWLDPAVSQVVARELPSQSPILIDIEAGLLEHPFTALTSLAAAGHDGLVLIRLMLTEGQVNQLGSDSIRSHLRFRLYICERRMSMWVVIFAILGIKGPLIYGFPFTECLIPSPELGLSSCSIPPTIMDWQGSAVRNILDVRSHRTKESVRDALWAHYMLLVGKYESRLGYSRWTDVLWAVVGSCFGCVDTATMTTAILSWRAEQTATVEINGTRLCVHYTQQLERYLLNHASRLSTLS
jgi:hypothetical protein